MRKLVMFGLAICALVGCAATLSPSRVPRRLEVIPVAAGPDVLQAAFDAAPAGAELVLGDGLFTSSSGSNVLSINKDITLRAQNSGLAVLDGEDKRRVMKMQGTITVYVEGLEIINGFATEVSARSLKHETPSHFPHHQ